MLGLPSIVAVSLFLFDRVEAISFGSYKAVTQRKVEQKRTVGSGSRSSDCTSDWKKDSLTLLIPEEEVVHHTVSDNPTLYVYARQTSSEPLIFNLVSPEAIDRGNPLFEKQIVIDKLGVNKISVPSNISLENNKLYLWQIGFPCKENFTSVAKMIKGAIEKTALTEKELEKIENTNSSLGKAKIYASYGIWYDALQTAIENENLGFFELLLEEVNLTEIDLELKSSTLRNR